MSVSGCQCPNLACGGGANNSRRFNEVIGEGVATCEQNDAKGIIFGPNSGTLGDHFGILYQTHPNFGECIRPYNEMMLRVVL